METEDKRIPPESRLPSNEWAVLHCIYHLREDTATAVEITEALLKKPYSRSFDLAHVRNMLDRLQKKGWIEGSPLPRHIGVGRPVNSYRPVKSFETVRRIIVAGLLDGFAFGDRKMLEALKQLAEKELAASK
jgi:predicted transcriptional regulator